MMLPRLHFPPPPLSPSPGLEAPLQDEGLEAGPGQVVAEDQPVVLRSDDDDVEALIRHGGPPGTQVGGITHPIATPRQ